MKYLDKREKDVLEKEKKVIKDEKEIFDYDELTIKEIKMRHLKEKILAYAEKNTEGKKEEVAFKIQDSTEDDFKPKKDKKTKALYGRYEDVPTVIPEEKAWEASQGSRTKGTYRTIDEIELKAQKNYDIVVNNPIKFIKQEIINKSKKQ